MLWFILITFQEILTDLIVVFFLSFFPCFQHQVSNHVCQFLIRLELVISNIFSTSVLGIKTGSNFICCIQNSMLIYLIEPSTHQKISTHIAFFPWHFALCICWCVLFGGRIFSAKRPVRRLWGSSSNCLFWPVIFFKFAAFVLRIADVDLWPSLSIPLTVMSL